MSVFNTWWDGLPESEVVTIVPETLSSALHGVASKVSDIRAHTNVINDYHGAKATVGVLRS